MSVVHAGSSSRACVRVRASASGLDFDARVDVSKFSDNARHPAQALLLQLRSTQEEL
jgi:hypothetical protein